ncbi:MAG: DUF5106 domain-containing protein [Odoribacter sp.]|nr:DUF5106 domain-containing protein [Odoribacter sp.]
MVKNDSTSSDNNSIKTFKMVEIPPVIMDEKGKINYLALHYWDNFDFSDTTYINLVQITEPAFTYYIELLHAVDISTANTSIRKMLVNASGTAPVLNHFLGLYEKYLWNPNSPVRNDRLYEPVVKFIIDSAQTDEAEKVRAAYRLGLISKNRIGEKATDFYYTLASGKEERMQDIKADYLILYFYNPDCFACKEITTKMNTSSLINKGLENKKIAILAFYSDEDREAWNKFQHQMPSTWINAYDARMIVQPHELYDLKAIPTLYLLDKEKNVILKDADFRYLENYLSSVL